MEGFKDNIRIDKNPTAGQAFKKLITRRQIRKRIDGFLSSLFSKYSEKYIVDCNSVQGFGKQRVSTFAIYGHLLHVYERRFSLVYTVAKDFQVYYVNVSYHNNDLKPRAPGEHPGEEIFMYITPMFYNMGLKSKFVGKEITPAQYLAVQSITKIAKSIGLVYDSMPDEFYVELSNDLENVFKEKLRSPLWEYTKEKLSRKKQIELERKLREELEEDIVNELDEEQIRS